MFQKIRKALNKLRNEQKSNSRWITVLTTKDIHFSTICKMALDEEDIPVLVFDQRDSSYNAFGDIVVQVLKEDMIRAQKILNLPNE